MTNFVALGSPVKNRSLTHFILPTSPDILARLVQTVCLGYRMSYFILPVIQILFINCATAADKVEVWGGRTDKNDGGV